MQKMTGVKVIKVKVYRYDPGNDEKKRYETYQIPFEPKMRILQALFHIRDNIDESLSFRWNCRAGACGSCTIRLNGKPVLACKTKITEKMDEIVLEPLLTLPVVKDLVVDRTEAEEKIKKFMPWFRMKKTKKGFFRMCEDEVALTKEMRKCIHCLACYDVCHVIRDGILQFIGPKHIVKLIALDTHPKERFERVPLLNKEIFNCYSRRCCSEVCPQEIRVGEDAMVYAKERVVDEANPLMSIFKKFFGGRKWEK